jgi:hypothetical protein
MAQLLAKVHELKQKTTAALADVPDNLIGTIITLSVLTAIGLGILLLMGYKLTNPIQP